MEGLRHSVYIRADGYNLLAARPIESAQKQPFNRERLCTSADQEHVSLVSTASEE
jgi:hypothetical protein